MRFRFSLRAMMLGVAFAAILLSFAVSVYRDRSAQTAIVQVTSLAFSDDRRLLAAGYEDGTVRLWDMPSGGEARSLRAHSTRTTAVAFCPEGSLVATGADDGEVKVWTAGRGSQAAAFQTAAPVQAIHFAPGGETIAVLHRLEIQLWTIDGWNRRLTTGAAFAAFSQDGRRLAVRWFPSSAGPLPKNHHDAVVFDTRSGAPVEEDQVAFTWFAPMLPDGTWTAYVGEGWFGSRAYLWRLDDNRFIGWHKHNDGFSVILSLAIAPTGAVIATGGKDGTVKLWDPRPAALGPKRDSQDTSDLGALGLLETETGQATSLAFSKDGSLLAVGGFGNVEIWSVDSQTVLRRLPEARPIPWTAFAVAFGTWIVLSLVSCLRSSRHRDAPYQTRVDREEDRPRRAWQLRSWAFRAATLAVVAMLVLLVSWFLARYAAACRQHRAAVALAKRGATVCYDYQYGASGFDPCLQPPDSGFLLRWLGRDFIHRIVEIDCSHARPIGFRDRTAFVGDGDAEALAHLPDLREINLAGQPITDAGLAPLARLRSLSRLILSETDITDSGLSHLETLRSLALLKLDETKVTAAAVERLRERLPGARITFNTVENTIWDQRRKQ